jgi:GABA(A) receptor-associated protein
MSPEKALYLFVNGNIPTTSYPMSFIYEFYKDTDGYLYFLYTFENTFG